MTRPRNRRALFAPEVIQTSSMDCGPAALKSLLEGHGINVSYGRLREACATDLDGTSIDTLEDVAREAGLDAEQVLVPHEHVLEPTARCLPGLAAVSSAAGVTHFIVVWRTWGPLVQVMDPARGRLWMSREALRRQMVTHTLSVPARDWSTWAQSDDFIAPLTARLRAIGLSAGDAGSRINAARERGWRVLATLDAATRMLGSLHADGALRRRDAARALDSTLQAIGADASTAIPDIYWAARPSTTDDTIAITGAVLVRVRGRLPESARRESLRERSQELSAAFTERPVRPLRDLFTFIRQEGLAAPLVAAVAIIAVVLGMIFEALLLRSAVDLGALVQGPGQAIWAGIALMTFALVLLGLEIVSAIVERRMGSHLEARLRIAFLDKLPRLSDAYFLSRPIADMLERSHTLHLIRTFPRVCVRFGRVSLELAITGIALSWLNPELAWFSLSACLAAAAIPLIGQSVIAERDLRTRTHAGALARFHLDALRGRTALEAHNASGAIEKEHEMLLSEWAASALALQRTSIVIEGVQMAVGFGLAAWMLVSHVDAHGAAPLLLQAYWMLNLPGLGYELALLAREYPSYRSTIVRLLEPLGAPDSRTGDQAGEASNQPVVISYDKVAVHAAGHPVLEAIDLQIRRGEHIAIVGPSGAGKSTLIGLLLGWHRPAAGELRVDGNTLTGDRLEALRTATAWVEPGVHLWNASLLDNLLYGNSTDADAVGGVLEPAGLLPVIARLPDGLATTLGEGGARLSAGEAQRVRFARALLKPEPRLVLLDEPFVGLERERRRSLLSHARQRWAETTMLYVTHEVPETRAFDRVLVIERGRIVEDGDPRQLANNPSSRYRRLLQAHDATQHRFTNGDWRRLRMDAGRVVADHARSSEQSA